MHCVVLCALAAALDVEEEEAIGELAGLSAYDLRLRTSGCLPQLLLQLDDIDVCTRVADRLRGRGHGVIRFDARDALPLSKLTAVRRFSIVDNVLHADGPQSPTRPIVELVAVIDAQMRVHIDRHTHEVVIDPSPRGAVRSVRKKSSGTDEMERIAMLVWRDGSSWLLRPSQVGYAVLGDAMKRTVGENFRTTIETMLARAPSAIYDDRFFRHPLATQTSIKVRDHDSVKLLASDPRVERTLHALALWLRQDHRGPHR